ncbi:50S ribosomal protein L18 [Candidatus Liberibacter asiaticus]|uniref:Large ribosomal subunit protein uL18 n=2 Tax=Liberibacter asiaticus TaxID=34021 RepID=C6XHH5_LIBAP|nr:50S ribosomal protein L18 [Candidatus Liberibacter asiaticus]ACT56718.1 50S ribosomal protein L18 [Candidatus Liberibacter asiaticus str. psy62]AGH16485.1 50S ribosomal protein L18 [Candidatus Liberibacter asiaticus str. gxpsy]ALK06886.1 50S ribosomal protein L18 [Candidatus Liberibacter asiaticus]ASK52359.1 50S ribosomal protein L18 [Candidatus Liberibacter asiaticus]AWL13680.1 50S ribosomal protein L18 [Candidatus Liberibacter asiaticus]
MATKKKVLARRISRIRRHLKSVSRGRLRLSVCRSSKHIYGQIIDDSIGHTLVSASSLNEPLRSSLKTGANIVAATAVGNLLVERAVKVGVKSVYFDRGKHLYCGRIAALADAVRKGGVSF